MVRIIRRTLLDMSISVGLAVAKPQPRTIAVGPSRCLGIQPALRRILQYRTSYSAAENLGKWPSGTEHTFLKLDSPSAQAEYLLSGYFIAACLLERFSGGAHRWLP